MGLSGSEVSLRICLEAIGDTPPSAVTATCLVHSNIESPRGGRVESSDFQLPHEIQTPFEYISARGEYSWTMVWDGQTKKIADFSAMSLRCSLTAREDK